MDEANARAAALEEAALRAALRALAEFALGPTRSQPALFESVLADFAALAECGAAFAAELPPRGSGPPRVVAAVKPAQADGDAPPARGEEVAADAGAVADALRTRAPAIAEDASGALALPLLVRGELVGVVQAAQRLRPWDAATVRALAPLADALASLVLGFRRAAGRARAEEDLLRALQHLRRGAALDGLTGLATRASTLSALEEAARRAGAAGLPLAVAVLDLDHAKPLSERLGPDGFDQVLRDVARTLHETLRPTDWTGRWGVDAFAVALLGCDLELAAMVAERIRLRIEGASFSVWGGEDVAVTVSAGVASTELAPEEGPALAARAVRALDEAKRAGRNRVCVSRPARSQRA